MQPQLSVIIIGASATGLYLADQLMCRHNISIKHIDMVDRRPAPIGIAPYSLTQHPLAKIGRTSIHLLGNIEVGRDVSLTELTQLYSLVLDSTELQHASEHELSTLLTRLEQIRPTTFPLASSGLTEIIQSRNLAVTRWVNPLQLPTGYSLSHWRNLIDRAHGIPVCI
ncbi:hypothetical protein EML15_04510 [Corynebacterium sp. sy017]|uniref:hypothetical protein n=1 Tax=unclassified Corynebacterium TaxID=2624378 RepID=UPI001184E27D|nr:MULTISPECIES: hypothetical protein [unclassified Corynebacterium]MBP3088408.1 hypothetical protein [Corynebacterium sp. sy017]TSD91721.1 hypothetical protein ELY17_04510 [Corynebacterium sp. SY003]